MKIQGLDGWKGWEGQYNAEDWNRALNQVVVVSQPRSRFKAGDRVVVLSRIGISDPMGIVIEDCYPSSIVVADMKTELTILVDASDLVRLEEVIPKMIDEAYLRNQEAQWLQQTNYYLSYLGNPPYPTFVSAKQSRARADKTSEPPKPTKAPEPDRNYMTKEGVLVTREELREITSDKEERST